MTPGRFCSTPQNPQTTSFQVKSLARLSLSHAGGARLPRRQPSLASLVAQRHYLRSASLAIRPRRVPQAPSVFACVARRHDGIQNYSRALALAYRRHMPAAPSTFPRVAWCHGDVACISRLSRSHSGVRPGRRRSSLASLAVAMASNITRANLTLVYRRRASRAVEHLSRVARCHDDDACVSHVSRFDLVVRLRRRRSSLASLVIRTASQITRASVALACRRHASSAPSTLPRVARRHGGVACVSRL